jgi:hypothetical protein
MRLNASINTAKDAPIQEDAQAVGAMPSVRELSSVNSIIEDR